MTVKTAAEALEAALKAVPDVRVHRDLGARVDPPACVLGPPALTFEAYCAGATGARFLIYVVVAADDRALERLWELVPQVAAALADVVDVTVSRADPATYPSGGSDLPAYAIQTDVALGG